MWTTGMARLWHRNWVLYVHCDVGDKTQVDALIARILAAHEHIDMLVNKPEFFGPLIFWM